MIQTVDLLTDPLKVCRTETRVIHNSEGEASATSCDMARVPKYAWPSCPVHRNSWDLREPVLHPLGRCFCRRYLCNDLHLWTYRVHNQRLALAPPCQQDCHDFLFVSQKSVTLNNHTDNIPCRCWIPFSISLEPTRMALSYSQDYKCNPHSLLYHPFHLRKASWTLQNCIVASTRLDEAGVSLGIASEESALGKLSYLQVGWCRDTVLWVSCVSLTVDWSVPPRSTIKLSDVSIDMLSDFKAHLQALVDCQCTWI